MKAVGRRWKQQEPALELEQEPVQEQVQVQAPVQEQALVPEPGLEQEPVPEPGLEQEPVPELALVQEPVRPLSHPQPRPPYRRRLCRPRQP